MHGPRFRIEIIGGEPVQLVRRGDGYSELFPFNSHNRYYQSAHDGWTGPGSLFYNIRAGSSSAGVRHEA